jgi:DNA polymerase III alpha subunit
VEIISRNRGVKVDAHAIQDFKKDSKVKKLLRNGETNGCFYIESPAMRGLLVKLQCDNYLNLVAASSVIRPGVARSGMMREYIRRYYNPNSFDYIHPVMKEQLSETFGVMVYQEDVLKVCHHFAGLDLADADVLRRAMSGKFRSKAELRKIVDKFFSNCKARGYPDNLTKEVWRQIESFAGYSFSKAHSASYAVESLQSLYLKAHFPLEFMVAVINNFGGFYRTWVYVNEARRWGAIIELPCINNSLYKTTISGKTIYLGFVHIENLEQKISKKIPDEREMKGEYPGLEDFVQRIHPGIEQLTLLIRINAFRFTGKSKKELLWQAYMLYGKGGESKNSPALFNIPAKKFKLPELKQSNLEDAFDEIELLGFPVTISYFNLLKTPFRGEIKAKNMKDKIGRKVRMVGHLVTIKYIKTVKKEWMHFAAFIDDTGEFFDTVHFPLAIKRYPFRGSGTYLILGKVVEEFGFPSVEVVKMTKLATLADPRY